MDHSLPQRSKACLAPIKFDPYQSSAPKTL
jgi:hypothetical protein